MNNDKTLEVIPIANYRSECLWREGAIPGGHRMTYADHPTFEDAVRGCIMVMEHGYGGQGLVFPERLWVKRPDGLAVEVTRELLEPRPANAASLADAVEAIRRADVVAEYKGHPKRGNRRERRAAAARARKTGGEPDVVLPVVAPRRGTVTPRVTNREKLLRALRSKR